MTVAPTDIPEVKIEDVMDAGGMIYVEGYLKQPFLKMSAYGGSYGAGVIVKDNYKLPVKILRYDDKKVFQKGSFLRLLGQLFVNYDGAPQFVIQTNENTTLDEDKAALLDNQLRIIGFQTPKRKHEGFAGQLPNKRSPFDK
ncbi:uncharacterized protein LOC130665493 [Microplitis mediator]|uniref:uncharacterized protein LOC130665493 n=1 Tax=Microplitis mediator TaxID=375433 RepID=UPI002556E8D8|nr:uncharacterized protein LOC130665493 [Microplitis mediator]